VPLADLRAEALRAALPKGLVLSERQEQHLMWMAKWWNEEWDFKEMINILVDESRAGR
jgi:hypothetical protein